MKKMNSFVKCAIAAIIFVSGLVSLPVFAVNDPACQIDPENQACQTGGNIFDSFQSILNVIIAVVGVIAVIVIIIAGVTMSTSQGDPGKVKKARSAIIYSLIGLLVAISAWAIISFVSGVVDDGGSGGSGSGNTYTSQTFNLSSDAECQNKAKTLTGESDPVYVYNSQTGECTISVKK